MELSRRRIEDPMERQIVTGMIVSDRFLQEVLPFYDPKLMAVEACRTAADWCVEYFNQYGKAPQNHIQDIFDSHVRNDLDPADADIIATILAKASEEFERGPEHFNVDYLLDTAEKRFKERSLLALAEDLKAALASRDLGVEEAERVLEQFHKIERPRAEGIDPLTNREATYAAFAEPATPLFKFADAYGELVNHTLVRGGFVTFLAPPKRGKSWMLMEMALKAARAGCNVAFFDCGDNNEGQWLRRFHIRLSDRPYRHYRSDYVGDVQIPVLDCMRNQEDRCMRAQRSWSGGGAVRDDEGLLPLTAAPKGYLPCFHMGCSKRAPSLWFNTREVAELDGQVAARSARHYLKKRLGPRGGRMRFSAHSSGSLTISHVKTLIDMWERLEQFVPDVIVFDYADIIAPDKHGPKEFRHQQNEIWKGQRGLSQERHCLVLSATQSDSDGIGRKLLQQHNFSEDMRKLAHVTAMFGLNQTPQEKRDGLMRVNEIVVREGDFDGSRAATILQQLRIGRPVLGSYWDIRAPDEEQKEDDE